MIPTNNSSELVAAVTVVHRKGFCYLTLNSGFVTLQVKGIMAHGLSGDNLNIDRNMSDPGLGRGRLFGNQPFTPVAVRGRTSPEFCSTRVAEQTPSRPGGNPLPINPDLNDTAWYNLITHIAQEVGQSIISTQNSEASRGRETGNARTSSSGVEQSFSEIPSLNLTGVKLVMQSEAKEPPVFRGNGADKCSVHEWEDLMDTYLRKRGIPVKEHYNEILSGLMGKAKDIVKITLRSNTSLRPSENPKVIFDILKQHFSETSYSYMPLADFYGTVPVMGEDPVEYWVRLNKAVDVAEEALIRLGRQMNNPCQEAAMMFVKHCPEPTLSAIFHLKAPDKWAASEVQEHLDRYQIEQKEQFTVKSKRSTVVRNAAVHSQSLNENEIVNSDSPVVSPDRANARVQSFPQNNENCMKTLISLLDRALTQNNQAESKYLRPSQPPMRACKVCQSHEHSTTAHCRRYRLCFGCYKSGHTHRDCAIVQLSNNNQFVQSSQNAPALN